LFGKTTTYSKDVVAARQSEHWEGLVAICGRQKAERQRARKVMGMMEECVRGPMFQFFWSQQRNLPHSTYAVVVDRLRAAIRATAKPYDTIMVLSF
jgi:hypothetical protein